MPSSLLVAALQQADRTPILNALLSFKNTEIDAWLPPLHPFESGSLKSASWGTAASLPPAHLIQAVAASAPNHCIDGWSFVARAISSLVAGDAHTTRHLAYYAQLRAGMSILANLGVGIFNRVNFAVTSAGGIVRIDTVGSAAPKSLGMGTHQIVWEALRTWVNDPASAASFLSFLKVRGHSIGECIEALWPGGSSLGAAGSLIESWGLDLKRGRDEHAHRNISSYQPQQMNPLMMPAASTLSFISKAWRLFEPSTSSSFDNIDRFLLRRVLQSQHRSVEGHSRYREGAIASRYDQLPALIMSLASEDFLIGKIMPKDPEMLVIAKGRSTPATPVEMLARALILLRAATALTQSSFSDAGVKLDQGEMRAWIDPVAAARGFWQPTAPMQDLLDLWEDVEYGLLELEVSINPPPSSWGEWLSKSDKGLPLIAQAERIGVWSLGA